jgi:hypothetical protein
MDEEKHEICTCPTGWAKTLPRIGGRNSLIMTLAAKLTREVKPGLLSRIEVDGYPMFM